MPYKTPYYNSFESNPRLRVSRAVAACSRCRQAKIKCNGNLPACDACEKAGRAEECSSSNGQFAKGKERSFVASLEARIDKLQKRLDFAKARKQSVVMSDVNDPVGEVTDRKDSLARIRGAIRGSAARRKEASDMDQLVSDFGFLYTYANTRDFEPSSNMTFGRIILAASAMAAMPEATTTLSPPREAVLNTVYYYMNNVLIFYPVVTDVTLLSAVENLYRYGRAASAFEHWLVYMSLAIGTLCTSHRNDDGAYIAGTRWAAQALQFADEILVPGNMTQIQALVLLVQYAMLDPAHFDCWPLLGFAARSIVDIGFHQDPPPDTIARPAQHDIEQRRKVFYSVYALDRSISMVHIRSFSFADDATCVALPTLAPTVSLASMTMENLGLGVPSQHHVAILLFQLRKLQSKWYQELFMSSREPLEDTSQYIWAMLQELRLWFDDLPPHLPDHIRRIFNLEFLYSSIYCLAPSCRSTVTSELGKTLIFYYGADFISNTFEIVRNPPIDSAFLNYYDVLKVFFVARQVTAILDESEGSRDLLLNPNRHPLVPSVEGQTQLPDVPNRDRSENIHKAIHFIGQTIEIFDAYGQRWDDSKSLQMAFKNQVSSLFPLLCQRREEMGINGRANQVYIGRG